MKDRIELALGLIGTGDFHGLLDFGFTKRFYNAVLAFEQRERLSPDGILEPWELNRLNSASSPFFTPLGAQFRDHPFSGARLLVPLNLFNTEQQTPRGIAYERADENLSLSFLGYPSTDKSFVDLYTNLSAETAQRRVAYKRLRAEYFVVSGVYRGRNYYTWFSAIPGGSSGFTLSWTDSWEAMGSRLSILLANSFVPQATQTPTPELPQPVPSTPPVDSGVQVATPAEPKPSTSTGTGFRITSDGHILTNFHVAGRCRSLTVSKPGELPVAASLVAGDETNDLAVIKASSLLPGSVAAFRAGAAPKAGTDLIVYGFPLSDILASSGNVVTGNITSLAGLGNDSRQYQISAPVQPGNSGGPVIDRKGNVIGVVVSKLDTLKAAVQTGDIPQNVNFAIKSAVAMSFLEGAGISVQQQESAGEMDTPSLTEKAQGFTFYIECRK